VPSGKTARPEMLTVHRTADGMFFFLKNCMCQHSGAMAAEAIEAIMAIAFMSAS